MKKILLARTNLAKAKSKKLLVTKGTDQALIPGTVTAIHGKLATQDHMSVVAVFWVWVFMEEATTIIIIMMTDIQNQDLKNQIGHQQEE